MKILITGGSGFVGSRVAEFFQKKKHEVICNFYRRPIKVKNIKKIKLNITKKILIKEKIDAIIHCASKTHINCEKDLTIYEQNIKMMKNLLDLAKQKKIKKFIFLSSVSAYGKINNNLLYENDKPINPNPYGKSKIFCENLLSNFSKENEDFKSIAIRLPGTVGFGSHGNFISDITKKILVGKEIKISNKSSYFNNIIFVDDLSNFLLTLLKRKKFKYDFINIASNRKMKIMNVVNFIYSRLNKKKI